MLDIRKQQSWLPRRAMEGIFKLLPLLLPTSNQADYSVFVPLLLNYLLDNTEKGKLETNKTG